MDVGHFHRLEHAHNAEPPFATIVRVARELDVSLDWLALTFADEPKRLVKWKSVAASRKILLAAAERIDQLLADGGVKSGRKRSGAAASSMTRKPNGSKTST